MPDIEDLVTVELRRTLPALSSVEGAWPAIIAESVYTVDGRPEPMRGFGLSLIAELAVGAYLHVAVTAGGRSQTVVNKPNEFALDFRASRFGDRVTVGLGAAAEDDWLDLGRALQSIWGATELRLAFAYGDEPRVV